MKYLHQFLLVLRKKCKRNSKILLFIVVVAAYFFTYLLLPFHGGADLLAEKEFFKLRYRLKGKEKIKHSLCVINIDDKDLEELKIKPFDRKIFSELIRILSVSRVKSLVVDLLFQNKMDLKVDGELVQRTKEAGNVFYPLSLRGAFQASNPGGGLIRKVLWEPKILKKGIPYNNNFFKHPFSELLLASKGLGAISLKHDNDAISRRLPLIYSYKNQNEYIPSLVLAAICHYLDIDQKNIEVTFGKHIMLPGNRESGKIKYLIPIDIKGRMVINYSGPWKDSTENKTLRDIIYLYKKQPGLFKEFFAGTLVLVSDISSDKQDYSRGIFEASYPNSGILSNALNTVLTQNYLIEPAAGISVFTSLLFIILIGVMIFKIKIRNFRILLVVLFFLYLIIEIFLFAYFNILPRISLQLCGTLFALLGTLVYQNEVSKIPGKVLPEATVAVNKDELDKLSLIASLEINEEACREYEITPAQRKLLKVLQKGHTYKRAAGILGIQENTIKKQMSRIREKTDLYQKKELLQLFFPFSCKED